MALHDPKPPHPRDRYIPQVQTFCVDCDGEELELRCSLLLIRDAATVASRQHGEHSSPIMCHVDQLAGAYAFRAAPIEALRALRTNLGHLIRIATSLDQMEGLGGRG
jgi:hypothetical protein